MPMLQQKSEYTRAKVLEVNDIDEKNTLEFLQRKDVPETVAKQVYELVGGRLTMLVYCIDVFRENKSLPKDELYTKIKQRILTKFGDMPREGLVSADQEMPKKICEKVLKNEVVDPKKLEEEEKEDKAQIRATVEFLVDRNLLRYDVNGYITWHSQLSKNLFQDYKNNGYKLPQ